MPVTLLPVYAKLLEVVFLASICLSSRGKVCSISSKTNSRRSQTKIGKFATMLLVVPIIIVNNIASYY